MITYQLDPSSELLKTYLTPFKGTWKTLAAHLLPDDVLRHSNNVSLLHGKLRSRPGLLELYNDVFLDPTNSVTSPPTLQNPDPGTNTRLRGGIIYAGAGGRKRINISSNYATWQLGPEQPEWISVPQTDYPIVNNQGFPPRFAQYEQAGATVLIYVNGTQQLTRSAGAADPLKNILDPTAGPIPFAPTDVCISFDRIIVCKPPYNVQWSESFTGSTPAYKAWPALNVNRLVQTPDSIVAVRPLGTLNFAVYKEGNIFVALAQSGPSSQAFRFEHRGAYEGPCNPAAIVDVNGSHVYITPTGRVGIFDGIRHDWICDGIWPFLQDDLDRSFLKNVFGVYSYKTNEVMFWYPKIGEQGSTRGMVIINLPYPTAGITTYSYFLGTSEFACGGGISVQLFDTLVSPIIFAERAKRKFNSNDTVPARIYTLDKDTYQDANFTFDCSFDTGLFKPISQSEQGKVRQGQPRDNNSIYRPTLELYVTRSNDRGVCDVAPLVSNSLESDGEINETDTIDLTQINPNEYHGFNSTGSFIGIHMEWLSTAKLEYKGADVYGRKTP